MELVKVGIAETVVRAVGVFMVGLKLVAETAMVLTYAHMVEEGISVLNVEVVELASMDVDAICVMIALTKRLNKFLF